MEFLSIINTSFVSDKKKNLYLEWVKSYLDECPIPLIDFVDWLGSYSERE